MHSAHRAYALHIRKIATLTIDQTAAFVPGESPPLVKIPILLRLLFDSSILLVVNVDFTVLSGPFTYALLLNGFCLLVKMIRLFNGSCV